MSRVYDLLSIYTQLGKIDAGVICVHKVGNSTARKQMNVFDKVSPSEVPQNGTSHEMKPNQSTHRMHKEN